MKLRLTNHFNIRMMERGISLDHVKKAMRSPDRDEAVKGSKRRAVKEIDGKEIEVIYCREGFRDKKDEYILVTAYYL